MPDRPSAFAPFRYRAFRTLWIATLASNLGSLVQMVGAGWMMTSLTSSDNMVALVQASNTLPIMALALIAGAISDNHDRRTVMLAAQIFMCAVSTVLAIVAFTGVLTPWALLSFTFLIGCGQAMHLPAWQSSMRDIVAKEDLQAAVSLNSMSFNSMRSIGPAVGGLIVASAGPAAAFTLNAVSYSAVITALLLWHPKTEARTLPREGLGSAMSAGVRYVAMSPNLMAILSRSTVYALGIVAVLALMPLIARDTLGGTAVTFGILLGAFGLGGICGALASPRLRERFRTEAIVRGAFLLYAAGAAVVGLSTSLWLTLAALVLTGAAWVQALSLFNVSVQLSTPRWVVGRALSLYQTFTFGSMALGSWLWGLLSDFTDPGTALLVSSGVLVAGAAMGLVRAVPEFSSLDLDPLNQFSTPQLKLDLKGRSGPIMVMIDWEIAPENTEAFLAVMTERRRMRLRDGARQWVLLRDLENPEIWTESYHAPTWTEYIRHNQRRTKADAEMYDRLLALHRGPDKPRVHRLIERQTVPRHDDMPIIQNPKIL